MAAHSFEFSIDGEGVSPETVALRDLVPLLIDYESALIATARSMGKGDADDLNLKLTGVREGSDTLTITSSKAMYAAADRISNAIAKNNSNDLPVRAQRAIRRLWEKTKSTGWTVSISSPLNGLARCQIIPNVELFSARRMGGGTSILAKVNRVGGEDKPTAQIKIEGGETVTVRVSTRQLATELGQKLFQVLSLEGEAEWDIATWKMVDFVITGIGDFRACPATEAFAAMVGVAGDLWDEIDPDEYIRELRAD